MFQEIDHFVAIALAAALLTAACSEAGEEETPAQNDSLAVVPVGPGTMPDVLTPPDTPVSEPDTGRDSAADTIAPH
ncbi:MAG: hypothetical protein ACT4O1_00675 [Gemmatimonadota bacterium]